MASQKCAAVRERRMNLLRNREVAVLLFVDTPLTGDACSRVELENELAAAETQGAVFEALLPEVLCDTVQFVYASHNVTESVLARSIKGEKIRRRDRRSSSTFVSYRSIIFPSLITLENGAAAISASEVPEEKENEPLGSFSICGYHAPFSSIWWTRS
jgi:hypothetical protein